jgi:hypothetical protein
MVMFVILAVAALVAVGYLTYRVGLPEAVTVTVAFGAAVWAAISSFVSHF